jgi:hypothetical protein
MRTYATRNDLTKLQLAKLERDDPAAYLEYAAKKAKAKAGAKKEKGDKNNPKCNTGNYQCRGKKGVACIPKSKGCNYDLSNVPPERKAYIEAAVEGLKAEGAKPKTARIGRKLGAPIVELTPEQYGKALEMNISQLKLVRGDATREQLREIGVDVDGGTAQKNPEKSSPSQPIQAERTKILDLMATQGQLSERQRKADQLYNSRAEITYNRKTKNYDIGDLIYTSKRDGETTILRPASEMGSYKTQQEAEAFISSLRSAALSDSAETGKQLYKSIQDSIPTKGVSEGGGRPILDATIRDQDLQALIKSANARRNTFGLKVDATLSDGRKAVLSAADVQNNQYRGSGTGLRPFLPVDIGDGKFANMVITRIETSDGLTPSFSELPSE